MPLTYNTGNQDFEIGQTFTTKAGLDAAFSGGNYRMTGAGVPTTSLNLTTDNYPTGIPQVTSSTGTWSNGMLVVNPGQANTINVNTFTGYATSGAAGHMALQVYSLQGDNVNIQNDIATQNVFGLTATTTPLTSITVPAGTLTSGRVYQGHVSWDTLTTLDVPNTAVALFEKQLTFYIAAQAPGTFTQPPFITSQPTNQSGILGGKATITLGVTVGGSTNPNLSNLLMDWYFNGQNLGDLNSSGGKYTGANNGFGLTVNNLTAADAGNYSVRLGNAGGFVTSSTATLTIATAAAPSITSQPVSQTISSGSTVVFSVAATGVPTPTYQWRKDGVNISGATSATLVLSGTTGTTVALAGSYSCWVTNSLGTAPSSNAALTVTTTSNPGRLINLAILTPLVSGETMTMGTVLGGSGTSGAKPLLARAAGPSLAQFGITAFLPNPAMTLNSTSVSPAVVVATNTKWGGSSALSNAFASVGAFAYTSATSNDSALFQSSLQPGNYTVQVSDASSGTGTVIAELYDATPSSAFTATTPRLINVSVLKQINAGDTLTAGFVIGGSTSRTVLIRAIGPGLTPLGVGGVMPDPTMTLNNISVSPSVVVATNNDWAGSTAIIQAANRVGAFAVSDGASKDAMLLITLAPGSYTAQVSAVGNGGIAIVEIYEVP